MSNLKRFLALTLAMLMVVGAMAVSAKSFTDVASTDSYAEAVDVLSELGVILGTSTDEFSPEALVSREQMAMFIARLATAQPALFAGTAGAIFQDQKDPTYNAAIQYAYTNGIIAGRTATEFDGPATVTLQEAAAMLSRAVGYGNKTNNASYPYSYMVIANEINLLKGLEEIAPTAELTRGEVATMLYNALSAPKAVRTLLYTPDGQDFVVSIPDGFYGVKDDDGNVLPFDTLATKAWKFKTIASYIAATKDIGFTIDTAKTTKTLSDPVIIKDFNDGKAVSFATIAKYLPEDTAANDIVGVDLTILARGTKILKIDIVGDASTTTAASYDDADGKKLVTVDGTQYNLKDYFDGKYPSESDNCFYLYTNNVITKFTAADVAKLAAIKTGFFSIDVLNAGTDNQRIVFKPYAFSKVEAKDGALWVKGKTVKLINVNGAVENDYVTYFNGGDKNTSVIAIATKASASKLVSKDTAGKFGTLESGLKVPFNQSTITDSELPSNIILSRKYEAYIVNGVVLKLVDTDDTGDAYIPKSYVRILNLTGNDFDGYRAKVLSNTGVESTITIAKVNGKVIDDSDVLSATLVEDRYVEADGITATVGDTIVLDGSNILTSAAAGFKFDTDDTFTSDTAGLVANGSSIIDLNGPDVVLTDYTKVVVDNAGTYTTFTGKTFKGVSAFTTFSAVYRNLTTGVKELVYLYVAGTPITTITESGTLYVFVSKGAETTTSVSYNAINLATGAAEVVTFTDAAGTSVIGDYKTGAEAIVYEVKPGASKPVTNGEADTALKLYANGYAVGTETYSINNAKIYLFEDGTYKVKALADVAGKVFNGYVNGDLTANNAKYVILNNQVKIALTVVTPTITSNVVKFTTVTTTPAYDDVYYSLDGGTTYTKYVPADGFAITATVTAKVYVTKAGYVNSDVKDVVLTFTA